MTAFRYQALTPDGSTETGLIEAENYPAAIQQLHARRLELLNLRHAKPDLLRWQDWGRRLAPAIRPHIMRDWCQELSVLLSAGLPLCEALRELEQEDGPQHTALSGLAHLLEQGHTLSSALQNPASCRKLPMLWLALLAAGEQAGQLPRALEQLAELLDWQVEHTQAGQRQLLLPILSVLAVTLVAILLIQQLVPALRPMLEPRHLNLASQCVFTLYDWFQHAGPAVLLTGCTLLLGGTVAYSLSPRCRRYVDQVYLALPLLGDLHKMNQLASPIHALGLQYRQGISILTALAHCTGMIRNQHLRSGWQHIALHIQQGQTVCVALTRAQLPLQRTDRHLLHRYESAGELATGLILIGERITRSERQLRERWQKILQAALQLGSGLLLGGICLALLVPLYAQMGQGAIR